MIVDAHGRGSLVTPEIAAAVAFLLRRAIRDMENTQRVGVPRSIHRLVDELDALAHEHAARQADMVLQEPCQARSRSRDSRTKQAHAARHEQQSS